MKPARIFLTFFATLIFAMHSGKADISDTVNTFSKHDNHWLSKTMIWPHSTKVNLTPHRIFNGRDFFQIEYGRRCIFDTDWIAQEGFISRGEYKVVNERLIIKGNDKGFSFGFGAKNNKRNRPGIGFGNEWANTKKNNFLLVMTIEQSVPSSDWTFTMNWRPNRGRRARSFPFKVNSSGEQTLEIDLGWLRPADNPADGITFSCKTPGVTAKIRDIIIRPYTARASWRRIFSLAEKPLHAQLSYQTFETYDLYINGKQIDKGTDIYPTGVIKHADITPYLQQGKNIIAMQNDFAGWGHEWQAPNWLVEGIIYDRKGKITRIQGDDKWRVAIGMFDGFQLASFDDAGWDKPNLTDKMHYFFSTYSTARSEKIFTGLNPRHMGLLKTSPAGHHYPLFDYTEKISYEVRLPAGIDRAVTPTLTIADFPSHNERVKVQTPAPTNKGDWKVYEFVLPKIPAGPYLLNWKLVDGSGKKLEEKIEDFAVLGPIKQTVVSPEKVEEYLSSKLELLRRIDCTQEATTSTTFLDHSGMYRPTATNLGRVTKNDNFSYRETGKSRCDYFAYKINFKNEKGPLLVEVMVPDDKDRLVFSSIHEGYPVRYINNLPNRRMASCVATAAAITGRGNPLSGKMQKIRYLYYPGSSQASVSVMNGFTGSRAAASEINIYRIKGDLPQISLPSNNRYIGPFTERPSNTTETFGAQYNVFWNDMRARNSGMEFSWAMSYLFYADKIKFLRFNGQNFSGEGVYMYDGGDYASVNNNSYCRSNKDFDMLSVGLRMYAHNGIDAQVGLQYMSSPKARNTLPVVSNRRVRNGADTLRMVDRHGRQMYGRLGGTWSFLAPKANVILADTVREIYNLYKDIPSVTGFFVMSGYQTSPGFSTGTMRDINDFEVGYGDYEVQCFERDTGIQLGIKRSDPERFEKRYQILTTKYAARWWQWRQDAMTAFLSNLQQLTPTWNLHAYPYFVDRIQGLHTAHLLKKKAGTRQEQQGFVAKRLRDGGYDYKAIAANPKLTLISKVMYENHFRTAKDDFDYLRCWNNRSSMNDVISHSRTVFWASRYSFFIEIDQPAKGAKNWVFKSGRRGVYMPRPIGENQLAGLVEILARHEVNRIYTMWLDCNFDTNVNPALRRFSTEFRAIPQGDYRPFRSFCNGNARIARINGKTVLRITNNTPYPLTGELRGNILTARNMAYDKKISASGAGRFKLSLRPQELLTLELTGAATNISGELHLPANAAAKTASIARAILEDKKACKEIDAGLIARLRRETANKNFFKVFNTLKDFELSHFVRN